MEPAADDVTAPPTLTGSWRIDPRHSHIGFQVRHAMITTVRGRFTAVDGTAVVDETTPAASQVDLSIDVASVETGVADRDRHLRTGDFFDVEQFPTMSFSSTRVDRDGSVWTVTGDLTIKEVTRPVTIDFEHTGVVRDPHGHVRAGFEGEVSVNRKDWNLSYNTVLEAGGSLIGDKVKLVLDVSAIRVD